MEAKIKLAVKVILLFQIVPIINMFFAYANRCDRVPEYAIEYLGGILFGVFYCAAGGALYLILWAFNKI